MVVHHLSLAPRDGPARAANVTRSDGQLCSWLRGDTPRRTSREPRAATPGNLSRTARFLPFASPASISTSISSRACSRAERARDSKSSCVRIAGSPQPRRVESTRSRSPASTMSASLPPRRMRCIYRSPWVWVAPNMANSSAGGDKSLPGLRASTVYRWFCK